MPVSGLFKSFTGWSLFLLAMLFSPSTWAVENVALLDLTGHWVGFAALAIFFVAYALVIAEEQIHMRKSKPVIVAAGLIWGLIALIYAQQTDPVFHETAGIMIRHNLLEYAELFLFLLAAMTYINTMGERGIFDAIRAWLVNKGFSLRPIFWLTGLMAFFISPVADNLTTALLMATVVMAVAGDNHKFIAVACINIVVAANAGGAFSPFGDITTLMVWQKGVLEFHEFFALFVPSLINWLIKMRDKRLLNKQEFDGQTAFNIRDEIQPKTPFNIFDQLQRAEWDTLMFFYGIILCVGGLGTIGYLSVGSEFLYGQLGATTANIMVGLISAVVDNIPVMFAVLSMMPEMSHGQWLLATLTAGVGGSLLSIGSAAGVAVMGQARGIYTFMSHLKWIWAIALGYVASIWVHLWLNADLFVTAAR